MKRFLCSLLCIGVGLSTASALGPFQYYPVTPCRVVDTRYGNAPALSDGVTRSFLLVGQCGIPAGAQAAALNLTALQATNAGWVSAFSYPGSWPGTSTINFTTGGSAVANGAIVPLGTDPSYSVSVLASVVGYGAVDVIIDVTGYFK